jgi:hypothetical protein
MGMLREAINRGIRQGVDLAFLKFAVIAGRKPHPPTHCLRCDGVELESDCAVGVDGEDKRFPCLAGIYRTVWEHNDNVIARRRVDRWRLAAIAGWTVVVGLLVAGWVG